MLPANVSDIQYMCQKSDDYIRNILKKKNNVSILTLLKDEFRYSLNFI